jgi:hypothetical protein
LGTQPFSTSLRQYLCNQMKPAIDLALVNDHAGPKPLPPAWREFIRFCANLQYGEIEHLSIQDGLPVLAEMTRKKVKFTGGT